LVDCAGIVEIAGKPTGIRPDELSGVAAIEKGEVVGVELAIEVGVSAERVYTMENVTLTPHIAGSVGRECGRMGRYTVEELRRYLAGHPLLWAVTPELAARTSHRPVVTVSVSTLKRRRHKPTNAARPT
jgi:hypothetical protein